MSKRDLLLLERILLEPDDDGPRLVYADHLLEQGDPRGEFIRLQLQLRRSLKGASGYAFDDPNHPLPENHAELKKRELALFKKHQKAWVTPVRAAMRTWYWVRGFLDTIRTGPTFFAGDAGATLLRTHPVTNLYFEGMKPSAFEQLAKADFAKVRTITIYGRQLNSQTAQALTHPNLQQLESLIITYSEIGAEGLAALAKSHLRSLKYLSISGNYGDEGLIALARSGAFDSLQTLNLIDPEITDRGLEALAEAAHFPKLGRVELQLPYYFGGRGGWTKRGVDVLTKRFGGVVCL